MASLAQIDRPRERRPRWLTRGRRVAPRPAPRCHPAWSRPRLHFVRGYHGVRGDLPLSPNTIGHDLYPQPRRQCDTASYRYTRAARAHARVICCPARGRRAQLGRASDRCCAAAGMAQLGGTRHERPSRFRNVPKITATAAVARHSFPAPARFTRLGRPAAARHDVAASRVRAAYARHDPDGAICLEIAASDLTPRCFQTMLFRTCRCWKTRYLTVREWPERGDERHAHARDHRPDCLRCATAIVASGGQQQRVAVARARGSSPRCALRRAFVHLVARCAGRCARRSRAAASPGHRRLRPRDHAEAMAVSDRISQNKAAIGRTDRRASSTNSRAIRSSRLHGDGQSRARNSPTA